MNGKRCWRKCIQFNVCDDDLGFTDRTCGLDVDDWRNQKEDRKVNVRRLDNDSPRQVHCEPQAMNLINGFQVEWSAFVTELEFPLTSTISMRCICTWKLPEKPTANRCAKGRLVVRGDTDLALTSVRTEAPTVSRLGCKASWYACSPHRWNLYERCENRISSRRQGSRVNAEHLL